MRRQLAVAVLSLCCLSLATAWAAEAPKQETPPKPPPYTGLKKRIAVMPIVVSGRTATERITSGDDVTTTSVNWNSDASPGQVGASLTEQLTTALTNTGRFVVLERKGLDEVLGEQDLGASGRVNKETAAPKGRVIGAEWMIKAAITEYTDRKSRSGGGIAIGGIAIGGTKREAFLAMDVRIVDAATGEVIDSVKADGRAKSSGTLGGIALGGVILAGGKEDTTPIGQATRAALTQAVDFICQRMEQVPWQSRVMEVDGKEVTITGGANMNIRVGDRFDAYHRGKALVDPETGQTLGYRETRLGPMKITEVMDKFSVGIMLDGALPQRGDVVKCPPPAAPARP
jgi:curli biogenesis system outer membrane secretion channel CsgG